MAQESKKFVAERCKYNKAFGLSYMFEDVTGIEYDYLFTL